MDISLATMKEFAEFAPTSAPNCNQLESQINNSLDRFFEIEEAQQEEFHADEIVKSNAARAPLESVSYTTSPSPRDRTRTRMPSSA